MRRGRLDKPSAEWESVRAAVVAALGECEHGGCFLKGLRAILDALHGGVALCCHQGRPVAALWRVEERPWGKQKPLQTRTRCSFCCEDAELLGMDYALSDSTTPGDLRVPSDTSIYQRGDEVTAKASAGDVRRACARWLREARTWSAKPGARAALVFGVQDGRLVWVGVRVARVPRSMDAEEVET